MRMIVKKDGKIKADIHEAYPPEIVKSLKKAGYTVIVKDDQRAKKD